MPFNKVKERGYPPSVHHKVPTRCVPSSNPCLNEAECIDDEQYEGGVRCECGTGWTDTTCAERPCTACPTCDDDIQNQGEAGIDCGGPCTACPTCNDDILNQGEDDVDCGGPCAACPTCNDRIQNQGEDDVDCGGPCTACATCDDNIQNQGETGVDCGGPCTACATCDDGIQNQGEQGVDCGDACGNVFQEGQGDCDKDYHCESGLVCGIQNCDKSKFPSASTDCCEKPKDPKDPCPKFNGIPYGIGSNKAVCCHKTCPKCGGKGCSAWKEDKGKKLGASKCCHGRILKRGRKCGAGGRKAPCKL